MTEFELNGALRRFYAEARNKSGQEYSRSSLLGFRKAVERHFAANGMQLKLTNNPTFQASNKMLECKLKVNRREGKENVQHKPIIEPADIRKMKESPFLSFENSAGLLAQSLVYCYSLLVPSRMRTSTPTPPRQFRFSPRCRWSWVRFSVSWTSQQKSSRRHCR